MTRVLLAAAGLPGSEAVEHLEAIDDTINFDVVEVVHVPDLVSGLIVERCLACNPDFIFLLARDSEEYLEWLARTLNLLKTHSAIKSKTIIDMVVEGDGDLLEEFADNKENMDQAEAEEANPSPKPHGLLMN